MLKLYLSTLNIILFQSYWKIINYIKEIKKIYITASGGPFLNFNKKLKSVKPKDALKHPKWKMGKKITIDSANGK